jgi:HK97 family phage major capsid protein
MRDNRALRSQRSGLLKEARALSDRGRLSPADQTKFDKLMRQADELKQEIEDVESSMIGPIRGDQPDGGGSRDAGQDEYKGAFMSYLRYGRDAMPQEARSILDARRAPAVEQRDMITGGTGAGGAGVTSGGFFVPIGFVDAIISTLKTTGPMLDPAVVNLMETDTGQILPYPASNDV